MNHFITEIRIKKVRHLSNINIKLDSRNRQHLMLTGKNGSGKTSLLLSIQEHFNRNDIDNGTIMRMAEYWLQLKMLAERNNVKPPEWGVLNKLMEDYKRSSDIIISVTQWQELRNLYKQGEFIVAYFPADRKFNVLPAKGVDEIKFEEFYESSNGPGKLLQKYMVHLKTQQAYARNEGDTDVVEKIQKWFERFTNALRILLDDSELMLEYDYKEYDFKIHQKGRKPFCLNQLSDGYSSVIYIVSDLILRMDHNWFLKGEIGGYDEEGIVLIDELETHLHIELQKKIMPFLTKFFPGIQFIVTTHSPYILNSISNAKIYDLERRIELENLSAYSSDSLAEGYFGADEYSDELKSKLERYQVLKEEMELTDDERAERAELRIELKNIPKILSPEAWNRFEEIEGGKRGKI